MTKSTWKVDEHNKVDLRLAFPGKQKVLLNGQEVARERIKKNTVIQFPLSDGRQAELKSVPWGGLSSEWQLRVGGQLIFSDTQIKDMACIKCGSKVKVGDKFCEKCGTELPDAENQLKVIRLKGARRTIAWLAVLFFVSGVFMFFIQRSNSEESWSVLILNAVLGVIMLGLYWYSRKSPLAALLMAAAVYASVIVLNAIVDPKTLGQGLVVKIFVIAFLVRGVQSALDLRKVQS